MHPCEYDYLKEWLYGSQKIVGIWPYLVKQDITDAVPIVRILANMLHIFRPFLDNDVVFMKIFLRLHRLQLLLAFDVNFGHKRILNINHNSLIAQVHQVLRNLVLQKQEVLLVIHDTFYI